MFRRPSLLTDISSLRVSGEIDTAGGDGEYDETMIAYHSAIDAITAPPRPFTPEEIEELGSHIRETLELRNTSCAIQAEEDAADLVSYVIDLIDFGDVNANTDNGDGEEAQQVRRASIQSFRSCAGGSSIGRVIEELEFMEMEICGPSSLYKMRMILAKYLSGLNDESLPTPEQFHDDAEGGGEGNGKFGRRNSYQSKLRDSDMHLSGIDLSAKTYAQKKREELASLSSKGCSLKDRMKMYNDGGTLRGSWQNPDVATNIDVDGIDLSGLDDLLDPASRAELKQTQLEDILNNVSLTEKEQTQRMKEVQAEFGVMEMKLRIRAASQRSTGRAQSAPDIGRDDDDGDDVVDSKKAIPRAERELKKGNRRSSVDLSAKSAAVKKAQELAYLKKQGSSFRDRMSMYSSQCDKKNSEEVKENYFNDEPKEKTNDDLRREELLIVMRDKSLSKEEKSIRMDEIKFKYAMLSEGENATSEQQEQSFQEQQQQEEIARWRAAKHPTKNTQPQDSDGDDSEETMETAATTKVSVVLSAKSYADRRRASLESLENSICSNDSGKPHVMSVKERLSMYQNNQEIVEGK